MCDATLYLGFHLYEIVGVFVWFDPWRQLFTKQKIVHDDWVCLHVLFVACLLC